MNIAVVGGGPAGVTAAGLCAKNKHNTVWLFEKNQKLMKKLFITGKGRCNVSNACDIREFLSNVPRGGRFLFSALNAFSPEDTAAFFESLGVPLKLERGGRLFPASDKSGDIIRALESFLKENGVLVTLNAEVKGLEKSENGFLLKTGKGTAGFDRVIIACGGLSYPLTGSSGDGYALAGAVGHTIIEPRPALCPIKTLQNVGELEGLSLKNVRASVCRGGKELYAETGEMLFTADSLTGPIILTLSSVISRLDPSGLTVSIDLKPALSQETLDLRIQRDFKEYVNKNFSNALGKLLPKSLIPYIVRLSGIDGERKVNEITREQRNSLIRLLKGLTFGVERLANIDEAIITSGGVELREIDPKTMESKIVKGLYFAGEVIDADAFTGGFNIQIALSTGYAAGLAASDL